MKSLRCQVARTSDNMSAVPTIRVRLHRTVATSREASEKCGTDSLIDGCGSLTETGGGGCANAPQCYEFDVERQLPVGGLKIKAQEVWGIPPRCQKLIVGNTVIDDFEDIGVYCSAEVDTLSVMLDTSLDDVIYIVRHCKRVEAVQDLGQMILVDPNSDAAFEELKTLWEEPNAEIRWAAVQSIHAAAELRAVARPCSGQETLSSYYSCISDDGEGQETPDSASDARLRPAISRRALAVLGEHLEHPLLCVRIEAVDVLRQLAGRGCDSLAVAEACARLTHCSADIRFAAVQALRGAAERNDASATVALRSLLSSEPSTDVKCAAKRALELPRASPKKSSIISRCLGWFAMLICCPEEERV